MSDFFTFLFYFFVVIFVLLASPFVVCHIIDHWDDTIYPHSGFSPECPTWEEPAQEPEHIRFHR